MRVCSKTSRSPSLARRGRGTTPSIRKAASTKKRSGGIACSGDVQIDLESAADAERAAKSPTSAAGQKVHVETRGLSFNRASGTALSDQPVKFAFPNGTGEAVGVEYDTEAGKVRLLRDVRMSL